MATSAERVAHLRRLMSEHDVRAYLVPSADPHLSEYLAPCFQRRAFISNFTGSSGTAVITESKAALWTDGRYYLQAEQQLDAATFSLMRDGLPDTPTIADWLQSELNANARVGVDAQAISINDAKLFGAGMELVSIKENLIDQVWGAERPPFPMNVAIVHPLEYAGKSTADKVEEIRAAMKQRSADVLVLAALDEVAWLLNVRGSDVDFNPVVLSYVIVTHDTVRWYVCADKVTDDVRQHLGDAVQVLPYEQIFDDLKNVPASHHVWLDGAKSTLALLDQIPHAHRIDENSPVAIPKAIKNDAEVAGFKECSLRDSVALVNFFSWLEAYLSDPASPPINEVQASDRLLEFREQQALFVSKSFDTISSTGANGAIIHYKPAPDTCAIINKDHFYLCDSGGQYRNGTTDVTRTFHFGQPSEHERRCYTRVLQCHIALARTVFPHGTTGHKLDVISRTPLWEDGLDFRHGTGHGFGSFLNVHEGPTLISFRESTRGCYFSTPLRANMTVTIEPGYYEDGHFGIRIENCYRIVDAKTPHNFGGTKFYAFEPFTLVPIQMRAVDASLLTHEQRAWINAYHATVAERLSPHLTGAALEWVLRETRPI